MNDGISDAHRINFEWIDYAVFGLLLFISGAIGFYWGFFRQQNEQDYLLGGRKLKVFPISMSLVASYISAISLLGIATESYVYGIQYVYVMGGLFLLLMINNKIFLPVYHELQITSTYEYLEKRFDSRLRLFGSILYTIGMMCWLPIVIYVPSLALNQVSGLNFSIITPTVCLLCIFYTCVGGLQAVIWTDVVQSIIMLGVLLLIAVKGTIDVGGVSTVIKRNWDSGRIEAPIWNIDPTIRHTIWNVVFGGFFSYMAHISTSQSMVQRFLSLPNITKAIRTSYIFGLGVLIITLTSCYCGLLTYARYHDCDPLTTGAAKAKDQLLPLLVLDVLRDWPGFCGLFIAGVFSAALSSLSTGLNSLALVILEDFYKPYGPKLDEKQTSLLIKLIVVVIGVTCTALVFVVAQVKTTVLQLNFTLGAISAGTLVGTYLMGLLVPKVHATGALIGGISGLIVVSWLSIGSQYYVSHDFITFPEKPTSIDGCTHNFTYHDRTHKMVEGGNIDLFRISYIWHPAIGALTSIIVGTIVSCIWRPKSATPTNPMYLAPFLRKFYTEVKTTNIELNKRMIDIKTFEQK